MPLQSNVKKTDVKRLARRRRQRGAAMVEAVMSIPFFIIIFTITIFLGKLYREKLRTIREAKQAAWVTASANCEGGSASVQGAGNDYLSFGAENNPTMGAPGTEIFFRPFKQASQQVDGSASAYDALGSGQGNYTKNVSTKTVVMCNEPPVDGQFNADFLFTYGVKTPWLVP